MNINQPAFRPGPAATVNIAAGVASANVQLQTGNLYRHVRLYNSGSVTVFVEPGNASGITASLATGMPVAAGATEIVSWPFQYLAAITASGSATLYCTPGEGM